MSDPKCFDTEVAKKCNNYLFKAMLSLHSTTISSTDYELLMEQIGDLKKTICQHANYNSIQEAKCQK